MADNWYATMASGDSITYTNWNSLVTDIRTNHILNTTTAHNLNTWVGTTNITTLGTIGTGEWQGTAIASTYIGSHGNTQHDQNYYYQESDLTGVLNDNYYPSSLGYNLSGAYNTIQLSYTGHSGNTDVHIKPTSLFTNSSVAWNGSSWITTPSGGGTGGGLGSVVEDTTPQLGGHLGGKGSYGISSVTYVSSSKFSGAVIVSNYISGARISGVQLYKAKDISGWDSTAFTDSGLKWDGSNWVAVSVSAVGTDTSSQVNLVSGLTSPGTIWHDGSETYLYLASSAKYSQAYAFSSNAKTLYYPSSDGNTLNSSYIGHSSNADLHFPSSNLTTWLDNVYAPTGTTGTGIAHISSDTQITSWDETSFTNSGLKWDGSNWVASAFGGAGSDTYKVKVDASATGEYLGANSNDGALRVESSISYTDGGDYVTLDVSENNLGISGTLNTLDSSYAGHSSNTDVHVSTTESNNWTSAYNHSSSTAVHLAKTVASGAMMKYNGTSWLPVSGAHMAIFGSKPTASNHRGQIIRVSGAAGQKTWVFASVKNDANSWEWIMLGMST